MNFGNFGIWTIHCHCLVACKELSDSEILKIGVVKEVSEKGGEIDLTDSQDSNDGSASASKKRRLDDNVTNGNSSSSSSTTTTTTNSNETAGAKRRREKREKQAAVKPIAKNEVICLDSDSD